VSGKVKSGDYRFGFNGITKTLFISFLLFFYSFDAFTQQDSITVCFEGTFKNERYKIYYNGAFISKLKLKGNCTDSVKIKFDLSFFSDSNEYSHYYFPIEIYRQSFFKLWYRNTFFSIPYSPKHEYLLIMKHPYYKRRYSIEGTWSLFPCGNNGIF
jgi:hypothetical protein